MTDTRTFIVIGASGGIGSAVTRTLAESANVLIAARREDRLATLADELALSHAVVDATDYAQVNELTSLAVSKHGRLDGIVNCAGTILLKPAHLTSDDEFDKTIAANLKTAFNTVKAGARAMMSNGGAIVLCSSAVALTGLANHEAIASAKAGITGLARAASATYASRGIRVNCVAPGLTRTPLAEPIIANEAAEKASVAMHALGRLGEPSDVASAICWLLDPANNWVTGQVIGVDGGLGYVRAR
ncbi:MAG: SDR family NAD(P)-dependent oxidoreductase [Rhodothermales bacterium]|nr:SDR family NAD(P)-dependent oxidoreductase [Rhodothermales bacterium]